MKTTTFQSGFMVAIALLANHAAPSAPAVGEPPPNLLGVDLQEEPVQVSAFAANTEHRERFRKAINRALTGGA